MGVFDQYAEKLFTGYSVELTFRDKVLGGTPNDPKIVQNWLKTVVSPDVSEQELNLFVRRTLSERDPQMADYIAKNPASNLKDLEKVVEEYAESRHTCGFKRDNVGGLYIESRIIKAAIKECTNILYAGVRWGPTKKGPKAFISERAFVHPARVYLGRTKADDVETIIGHVNGPNGPQNMLSRYEYVLKPTIRFEVIVLEDCITQEQWGRIFSLMQENGLGASRSMGHGMMEVNVWEKLKVRTNPEVLQQKIIRLDPAEALRLHNGLREVAETEELAEVS